MRGVLGAAQHGLWLSLVERFVRDEEAAGSNPASPIVFFLVPKLLIVLVLGGDPDYEDDHE